MIEILQAHGEVLLFLVLGVALPAALLVLALRTASRWSRGRRDR